jgi:MFS family permease
MSPEDPLAPSIRYRWTVLVMLTLVYTFNFIDRQILVILQEPIKADLGLSDAQLGLLSGFSFALVYVTAGIPIAWLADRGNRRNIVAVSLGFWSFMTALSGLAQNYGQLLAARIGVGIGEAGGSPPSHSMVSDYFPAKQRGTALSFYSTGIYIGILIGFAAGGWIAETFGWRVAFFLVGVPGIFYALLLVWVVKEPKRGQWDPGGVPAKSTFKATLASLRERPTFWWISVGCAFTAFISYGNGNFMPSFLMRSHGMTLAEVGGGTGLDLWDFGRSGYVFGRVSRRQAGNARHSMVPVDTHYRGARFDDSRLLHPLRQQQDAGLGSHGPVTNSQYFVPRALHCHLPQLGLAGDARHGFGNFVFHTEHDWSWTGAFDRWSTERSLRHFIW